MKKLLAILASTLIIFTMACSGAQKVEVPKDSPVSYCDAKNAPDWMKEAYKEDQTGNFGLLDWFGWVDDGIQFHLLKVDVRMADGNLDRECDYVLFAMGTSTNDFQIISVMEECHEWEEMKQKAIEIMKENAGAAKYGA